MALPSCCKTLVGGASSRSHTNSEVEASKANHVLQVMRPERPEQCGKITESVTLTDIDGQSLRVTVLKSVTVLSVLNH